MHLFDTTNFQEFYFSFWVQQIHSLKNIRRKMKKNRMFNYITNKTKRNKRPFLRMQYNYANQAINREAAPLTWHIRTTIDTSICSSTTSSKYSFTS